MACVERVGLVVVITVIEIITVGDKNGHGGHWTVCDSKPVVMCYNNVTGFCVTVVTDIKVIWPSSRHLPGL